MIDLTAPLPDLFPLSLMMNLTAPFPDLFLLWLWSPSANSARTSQEEGLAPACSLCQGILLKLCRQNMQGEPV